MALRDVKDLVIRYDGHPKYEINRIVEDDEIEVIVQKLEMILFTNSGEVIGSNMGINLEYYLWQTRVSTNTLRKKIEDQIFQFVPELIQLGYDFSIDVYDGIYRDILYLSFVIKGYNIEFIFE